MGGGSSDLIMERAVDTEDETLGNETAMFVPCLHHRNVQVFLHHLTVDPIIISFFHTGTQIYILNGTDLEGDPVRYGLSFEKGSKEYFRVDPKSGNVTLIHELDREVRLLINSYFEETCWKCVTTVA